MLKYYGEVFSKLQSFIEVRDLVRNFVGMIFPTSVYLINIVGMVWLFNNASLDNKDIIFYIFIVVMSVQAILQERRIFLMKEKLEEESK